VHQERDQTLPISFYLDHCGGLVFGADGMLYYATSRWSKGEEGTTTLRKTQGIVVQYNPKSGEKKDFAKLVGHPGGQGHYVSRGGRDRHGDLYFGQVARPIPTGISRLKMDAKGKNLHQPIRTWG
jgi:hypothetical protein